MYSRSDSSASIESVCDSISTEPSESMSRYEFILKARERYGSLYDYSGVPEQALNQTSLIEIECPKHGRFTQTAHSHLHLWSGCNQCESYSTSVERLRHKRGFSLKLYRA